MSRALLLVFVVDSSDPKRFPEAKEHLHELLTFDPCLPVMLLANKQVNQQNSFLYNVLFVWKGSNKVYSLVKDGEFQL